MAARSDLALKSRRSSLLQEEKCTPEGSCYMLSNTVVLISVSKLDENFLLTNFKNFLMNFCLKYLAIGLSTLNDNDNEDIESVMSQTFPLRDSIDQGLVFR